MKKLVLFFVLISALSIKAKAENRIDSGLYRVTVKGDVYYYRFHHDSLLTITHGKDTSYVIYSTDTTQKPMHFNMKVMDVQGNHLYTSPCIFEMFGPKRIRLKMSPNFRDRPTSFLPRGSQDMIFLVKVE
ncbi:MAG TPA: hypothetical protein VGF79_12695 [Bacteroidia bacterium]